ELPQEYNLIIKIHPNLYAQDPAQVEQILGYCARQNSILWLEDFPSIYPILDFVDIYIGDASSIGYDFLTFNKPMILLNQNNRIADKDPGLYLYRCGIEIRRDQYPDIYKILSAYLPTDSAHFQNIRKITEEYTFGLPLTEKNLKEKVDNLYNTFPEEELNFY
ncbi:MAG: hypothetical protein EB127_31980, partial [Alphaproteobacteria bacterium]|nr:hypothetical protein [Alphaproteobacteria bacterium]